MSEVEVDVSYVELFMNTRTDVDYYQFDHGCFVYICCLIFFFQAEDGIRDSP